MNSAPAERQGLYEREGLQEREDFREYVAQLQLHMTLQAKRLVPSLQHPLDSRVQLLHDTQALVEKLASRQGR